MVPETTLPTTFHHNAVIVADAPPYDPNPHPRLTATPIGTVFSIPPFSRVLDTMAPSVSSLDTVIDADALPNNTTPSLVTKPPTHAEWPHQLVLSSHHPRFRGCWRRGLCPFLPWTSSSYLTPCLKIFLYVFLFVHFFSGRFCIYFVLYLVYIQYIAYMIY